MASVSLMLGNSFGTVKLTVLLSCMHVHTRQQKREYIENILKVYS